MMPETFGQWLREKREKRGLNQEQLGKAAGYSKQHVSGLERAVPHPITGAPSKPTIKSVRALAEALDEPIELAMRVAGYYPPSTQGDDPRNSQLLALFTSLSDKERDDALALIQTLYQRRGNATQRRARSTTIPVIPNDSPEVKRARNAAKTAKAKTPKPRQRRSAR